MQGKFYECSMKTTAKNVVENTSDSKKTNPTKKDSKKNLFIVDGHALAYRAHYALINQHLQNKDGEPTETLFGFFRMLAKLLYDWQPDSLLIVFDPPEKNFRHELFPEYKATRKKTPDELKTQIEQIKTILPQAGFPVLIPQKAEADDLIASIVGAKEKDYQEIFLVSGDKDLFALLSQKTKLLRAKKGFSDFLVIDKEYIKENIGITPNMVVDFMAITGDSSDNVPGVKGIGEKGAVKLLDQYKTLDNIYKHLDEIKPAGIQKKLSEHKEEAYLSYKLVTLKKDLPVDFSKEDCLLENIFPKLTNSLALFSEMGLHAVNQEWQKLLKKSNVSSKKNTSAQAKKNEAKKNDEVMADDIVTLNNQTIDYKIITTLKQWQELEKQLKSCEYISVDCETTSHLPMFARLVGMSFSWYKDEDKNTKDKNEKVVLSAYVPLVMDLKKQETLDEKYSSLVIQEGETVLQWLKPFLENSRVKKVGQNIKYDLIVLAQHGVQLKGIIFDTMLASYLSHSSDRRHNLDTLALYYFNHKTVTYKELAGSGKKQIPLVQVDLDDLAHYACEDTHLTLLLETPLKKEIAEKKLEKLYRDIDLSLLYVLATMEQNGIGVDKNYLKKLEKELDEKLSQTEKEIHDLAQEEFNINSTKELQRILYEKLKIKTGRKTEGGQFSTDANVLEWLKNEHPIVEKILIYRGLKKLLGTYVSPLPEYIHPQTQRVHTSFSQIVAATGRLASSDPNLQNIPVKDESGKAIRRAFCSQGDNIFLSLDYSQIELRILAHYSEDAPMIEAFRRDDDIHDLAALLIFHEEIFPDRIVPQSDDLFAENFLEQIFKEDDFSKDSEAIKNLREHPRYNIFRSQAKVMNFSIAYGVTAFGLAQNLSIGRKEAEHLIQLYFSRFPGIKNYMDKAIEKTRENKISENFFGRLRSVKNIDASRRPDRLAAERLAINNPIQSTAADIIKLAMIDIHKKMQKQKMQSKMILQIHDELLFECPPDELQAMTDLAKSSMENIVKLKVPLTVNWASGRRWNEAKG